MNEKLFVVVRSDLRAGDQLCQAIHAATSWCMTHPEAAGRWHDRSNYLVVLSVPDERALELLCDDLNGCCPVLVHEPDLDDQATAFAVRHDAGRWLSSLPLAMRELSMT